LMPVQLPNSAAAFLNKFVIKYSFKVTRVLSDDLQPKL